MNDHIFMQYFETRTWTRLASWDRFVPVQVGCRNLHPLIPQIILIEEIQHSLLEEWV